MLRRLSPAKKEYSIKKGQMGLDRPLLKSASTASEFW